MTTNRDELRKQIVVCINRASALGIPADLTLPAVDIVGLLAELENMEAVEKATYKLFTEAQASLLSAQETVERLEGELAAAKAALKPSDCVRGKGDPPQDCAFPYCGCDPVIREVVGIVTEDAERTLSTALASAEAAGKRAGELEAALAGLVEIARDWEALDDRENIQLDNSDAFKRAEVALRPREANTLTPPPWPEPAGHWDRLAEMTEPQSGTGRVVEQRNNRSGPCPTCGHHLKTKEPPPFVIQEF